MYIDLRSAPTVVNCQDAPPAAEGGYVPLHSPKPGRPLEGVFVNPRPLGVMTHFIDGITSACITASIGCSHCLQGKKNRWKGFIGYYSHSAGRTALLELTPNAWRLQPKLCDGEFDLRGYGFKASRQGMAANSRMMVLISDHPKTICQLPPPFHPMPTLLRVWSGGRGRSGGETTVENHKG